MHYQVHTFNHFRRRFYNQYKFSSKEKSEEIFKIADQQPTQQSPPTTTPQESPITQTFSQTNRPQSSTRISFQENPYTFEERHALLSEPLISVVRHAPLSEPQYEPIYSIYRQDLNRTRHPSQNKNRISTIDTIIHPRRNRNFTTP